MRGRPVYNAGVRKQGWYEEGPSGKKRSYTCGLCCHPGHTRKDCELRQVGGPFAMDEDEDDEFKGVEPSEV